jgi:Protein of unknown function (DUF3313)
MSCNIKITKERNMKTTFKIVLVLVISLGLVTSMGWAKEEKMPPSGFLQDYSLLKADDPMKKANWLYINEKANFSAYDKIILDDAVFFLSEKAEYKGIAAKEMAELSEAFLQALILNLGGVYNFTDKPGPGVMRVRMAITELIPNKAVAGTVTTIVPVGLVLSSAKKAVTGSHIGMGGVSFEGEMIDSQSGKILGAVIDSQTGKKYKVAKSVSKWGHAVDIFNSWAQTFRARLDKLSGRE